MHSLFAGLMGVFMGFGNFFHVGGATPHIQSQTNQQVSVTPDASSLGKFKGMRRGMMNIPQGERPFFGTVINVNGNTLTVQMQMPMMRFRRNPSITPSITPPTQRTITVTLDSSTKYTGGSQSDITTNIKIAGVGKVNSDDGSIIALQIRINPPMPSGMPMMRGFRGQGKLHGGSDNESDTDNRSNSL